MLNMALDVSLRSVAAAAAVGLVLVALRVRSGAARHAAWSAVLLTMLTLPVLVAVVPQFGVPVPARVASSFDTIAGQLSSESRPDAPPAPDAGGLPAPAVLAGPSAGARTASTRAMVDARVAIAALYGAGVLVFFIQIGAGWILARRLVGRAVRVPVGNRAPVFETPAIAAPMTAGIASPCVLLPSDWREWPDDTLRAVLAHEHAHIARRDSLVALLARVNRAIFWFHPLAWWLERTLAVAAEHACDETAARQLGEPERYAEVLLAMADAVRHRGTRVAWQTLGVDGSGLLGTRIDRLLKGDVMNRMSAMRRAAVAVGCAAMLVAAIACRQQIAAAPLGADPDLQKQIDETNARMARNRAARAMTVEQAAALERSLEANPDNVEAHESLIIFYDQSGKATWEQKLAGIRKHALWRIAHLPDTDLWIPNISKRYDPDGYAQAKALWLEQASRPDVTAKTLGRAAAFFTQDDKPQAEALLIRAAQVEPAGVWTARLMDLYAEAITVSLDPKYRDTEAGKAEAAFAAEARSKIEAASDANVLASAGFALQHWSRPGGESAALARRLLERAAALDPGNARARTSLADFRNGERWLVIETRLRAAGAAMTFDEFSDTTAALVSALPIDDRLFYLPTAAESAYMRAEYIDYTLREKPEAQQPQLHLRAGQGFVRARQYATEALALAPANAQAALDNDVVYRAETVLGVLALKDGDRRSAVAHMRAAGSAPMSDAARYASQSAGLRSRLAEYLLRAGERASVAEYLERSADRAAIDRDQLLKDAARIREGMMPVSYQYAEARR
jgi:beta-lactamase regulating signal transducer with metallopeptidase domain